MRGLVSDMVQDDPAKRPTIDKVVTRFEAIQKKLWSMKLRSRAGQREEWFGPICDFMHFFKSIKCAMQKVPAMPSHSPS